MIRKIDPFSYTSLYAGPILCDLTSPLNIAQIEQDWTSIARLIQVGCRMFYSSKIHNIGYILLKQTPLKTPENLKEKFAVVGL